MCRDYPPENYPQEIVNYSAKKAKAGGGKKRKKIAQELYISNGQLLAFFCTVAHVQTAREQNREKHTRLETARQPDS